jgi:hypothetical protein
MERVPGNVRRREAFAGPADLARFFRDGRLETMPRRAKDREALLAYVASRFEPGREYPEDEVNSLLMSASDDVAMLRRYLIDARLLTRDHGVYRRG